VRLLQGLAKTRIVCRRRADLRRLERRDSRASPIRVIRRERRLADPVPLLLRHPRSARAAAV